MVTISRTRIKFLKPTSIRWQITLVFLVIIGVSFAVMASLLTGFVSSYLYRQRIRQDSLSVERLSTTVAPLFQSASSDALTETLSTAGAEMEGRLLVVDGDGKVQFDSFSRLMGVRLELPEVLSVLRMQETSSWGIHQLDPSSALSDSGDTVSYCVSRITGTRGTLGALMYVSRITELVASLQEVQRELMFLFMAIAVSAMAAALVLSSLLTRPITALTRTIQKMGRGDLSVRARVSGSAEMRHLAESYNTMAEQLEHLDQTRNQFVSNASHELKTPMTSMKILLENVIYQPDMPEDLRTEFLQDMNHEIDRLTSIVTDLLSLTQMDNGRIELKMESMDLTEVCRETVHLLTPSAEKRRQNLRLLTDTPAGLVGDRAKLGQVIYNLVDNALKYSPDGGSVQISLTVRSDRVLCQVRDEGVGISQEDQAHIFDRFYRVDKARSRETGGTGLGLSIVRQLILLHHGDIQVQSEIGKGSVFTVSLPRTQPEVSGK